MQLRELGTALQTCLGGRPFQPVTLQVGGFSKYPSPEELSGLDEKIVAAQRLAQEICEFLLTLKLAGQIIPATQPNGRRDDSTGGLQYHSLK